MGEAKNSFICLIKFFLIFVSTIARYSRSAAMRVNELARSMTFFIASPRVA